MDILEAVAVAMQCTMKKINCETKCNHAKYTFSAMHRANARGSDEYRAGNDQVA